MMRIAQILSLVAQCAMVARAASASETCNPQIDPDSVALSLRSQWCSGQVSTCSTLCAGNTESNTCDIESLCYTCICASNYSPPLQYYTNTMPTFQCEQLYANCIIASPSDAAAQHLCTENEQANCGHVDPNSLSSSPSSSSSSHVTSKIFASSTYASTNISPTKPATATSLPIISTTKTVTPSATGTTTIWSTSTAGQGNATSGNYSTLPGITDISTSGAFSTLPGITDIRTSTSGSGSATTAAPTTVTASGAKRARSASGWVWGEVVCAVVGVLLVGL